MIDSDIIIHLSNEIAKRKAEVRAMEDTIAALRRQIDDVDLLTDAQLRARRIEVARTMLLPPGRRVEHSRLLDEVFGSDDKAMADAMSSIEKSGCNYRLIKDGDFYSVVSE